MGAFKNEFVGGGAGDGGVKLIDLQRSKLTKLIRDLIRYTVASLSTRMPSLYLFRS